MDETRTLTVGEQIVVHLSQYHRHEDSFVCPPEVAQAGIADTLGISRAHAAIELKRALTAGRIEVRVAHVTGAPTRRKVYRLTPKGEGIARRARTRVLTQPVELVLPSGGVETVPGRQALEILRVHGVSEGRAVFLLLARRRIDLRDLGVRPAFRPRAAKSGEALARTAFHRAFVRPVAWQSEVVLGPPHVPPVPAAA